MNNSIHVTFCLFILLTTLALQAETVVLEKNTEYLAEEQTSPPASIENVKWIAGYWQGEIWGGQSEEIWSHPSAGSMMASFKFTENNQVKFYELMAISEHHGSLMLQLEHFGRDLTGWEAKDQSMNFRLVRLTDTSVYFEDYTYKLITQNEMHAYVVIDNDGKKQETKFVFKRLSQWAQKSLCS